MRRKAEEKTMRSASCWNGERPSCGRRRPSGPLFSVSSQSMAPLLAYLPGPENRRRPLIGRRPHIRTGRPCRRPAAMPQIEIRDALPADAEAIRAIYNDAVLHTTAVFDYTPRDAAAQVAWLAAKAEQTLPVLVATDGPRGGVAGRSAGPRVGTEGVRTCRSRRSPDH